MTLIQHVRLPVWRRHARCAGRVELFYAADDLSQRVALRVCAGCGVREDCLAECLVEERLLGVDAMHGIRGGMTVTERRRLFDRLGNFP
jgi:WhiB family transcriptional regulator, redox-sensing transcriptional regulator